MLDPLGKPDGGLSLGNWIASMTALTVVPAAADALLSTGR